MTNDNLRVVLNAVKRVLLNALACNQSTEVLKAMFSTQRSIVRKVIWIWHFLSSTFGCMVLVVIQ